MSFIEELQWRGMLHQLTPGIEEHLAAGSRKAYIGFDPTAASLTIGNYVQVMMLTLWARAGHHPVILFGGATGRIGDPSGKDKERQLKSYDELDNNLASQRAQMLELIAAGLKGSAAGAVPGEEETRFSVVNNLDFYQEMNVLDFLRNVGKTLTISYMMSKDSVQNRLESGMSFTEFSYQLLQGYDFQKLYQDHGVTVQMGGSDQWGNITAGTEFVRRNAEGKAFAVTTPLLTKADGSKFGKSEKGNLWLDPDLTGPYDFYQFWVRSNDADIPTYLKTFSLRTKEEILADVATVEAHGPENNLFKEVNAIKHALATELTERVHGPEGVAIAKRVTEVFYGRGTTPEDLKSLDAKTINGLRGEIDDFIIPASSVQAGIPIIELLCEHTTIVSSKSEARRAIQSNAIALNKTKTTDLERSLTPADLMHGRFVLVENGKKRRYLIVVE